MDDKFSIKLFHKISHPFYLDFPWIFYYLEAMSFNNILGQTLAISTIRNGLIHENLSQSLLFHGPKACGKMTTALSLAKAMNCLELKHDFCDHCLACRKINRFLHPDVYVVNTDNVFNKIKRLFHHRSEAISPQWLRAMSFYFNDLSHQYTSQYFALRGSIKTKKKAQSDLQDKITEHKHILSQLQKADQREFTPKDLKDLDKIYNLTQTIYDSLILDNIPVETIRQLIKRIYVKPLEARTKVFIINGLEWMKEEGANTFLKAIEEPPPQNIIVLITERIDLILPTIRSRCFQLSFQPLNLKDQQVLVKERLGLENGIIDPSAHDLWDHLKGIDRSNQADQLVRDFYENIAVSYQKGNGLFHFIDRVLEHCDLNEFFYALFDTFRMAKRAKYGVQPLDENTNPLYLQPDKALDKLVQEGEDLLPKIITFNLNPSLALTAYLMKVSRLLLSARRRL